MSSAERTGAIREAAAERTLDAARRARRAIRELEKRGVEVNFSTVARAGNVNRDFLYSHAELRSEIEQLRSEQRVALSHPRLAERASDASIRARLRAALDDNQRLREENAQLRQELELAHGTVRELELSKRTGRQASR
ncbi:MAG TPA: DUF6262 family protein [Kofleriaceae bacterium]|nr:DUF6262 family protein [Kofleriaceae bacterium]